MKIAKLAAVCCAVMLPTGCYYMGDDYYEGRSPEGFSGDSAGDRFESVDENPFIKTSDENVSTFSVDADGASYAIMRKYVNNGWDIPSSSVRIEEYLNYFTFDYPEPTDGHNIGTSHEVCVCPWNDAHRLLRLGIKGKNLSDGETPLANFVFLIDVSGSMYPKDKLDLFKNSLVSMLDYMKPEDRVSIITYSGNVARLLESTQVKDAAVIKTAIGKLVASGSTNGGSALQMAYDEALANYIEGGNNRIILGTDGDFNVGITGDDQIVKLVESYARKGIYITVCGLGTGNLNDAMMKKVAIAGNGTYYFIDSEQEMEKVFVKERSKFTAVANDVKVQVCFDKENVESYRLIGYERRVMGNKDYDDDSKDAAEIGAGQTVTALYEIVPADADAAELTGKAIGSFSCRYKTSLGNESIELPALALTFAEGKPSGEMSFAAGVAAYGLTLMNSAYKGSSSIELASQLVGNGLEYDPDGYRAELASLMKTVSKTAVR